MTLTVGRTRLKVHLLALMFPMMAARLGARTEALALLVALLIHEAAHLISARCLGVKVEELRLMPFGGAIRLENPYLLPPSRLLAVSAAGPLGSALGMFAAGALAHWQAFSPGFALALMRVNLTLMLFNLLPALPLDGGRMLYAALSPRLGPERAVKLGLWTGRAAALGLLALAAHFFVRWHCVNISFIFAAIFILASAGDERQALSDTRALALLSALRPVERPMPVALWALGADCDVRDALRVARPDALNLYAIYKGSRLASITDDRRLLETALERGTGEKVAATVEFTARPPHPGSGS